jgi:short-subunit dehydrogenase
MKNILILGANSAIAKACARLWAEQGDRLFLVSRKLDVLESLAADLRIRGSNRVDFMSVDLNDFKKHELILKAAEEALGTLDVCLLAHGTLSDQKNCEKSVDLTIEEISTNALSHISFLTLLANRFEQRKCGRIAVISSVAGDRGRSSNYIYGSAKAMLSCFSSGLRQRLSRSQVSLLVVKPGFVDTPMTQHLKKGALWAKPETVSRSIVKAIDRGRDTLYTPWFWSVIMLVIRIIPERLFKNLRF